MFLLDTNVISEMRKPRPHGGLLRWYGSQDPHDLFLPSIAIYELQRGAELTRRQDAEKAAEIEKWITELMVRFEVIAFDQSAAQILGKLMDRRALEILPDAMIAATAYTYGLAVATRNTQDFHSFPVRVTNPFHYRGQ